MDKLNPTGCFYLIFHIFIFHLGDVVTPGFTDGAPLSLDATVGLPHDSADGYMFDFAVNMETLLYLRDTDALPGNIDAVLYYMKTREYKMIRRSGVYNVDDMMISGLYRFLM